ncbi:MAG: ferritin-like domain-containing protein [Deltaproteobacteria bacterium]|nr:ferritin-like domain-containing protein [Deltaproteobacteria bacterium]
MDVELFVKELEAANNALLSRLAPTETLEAESAGDLDIVNLLKVALKNEIEASELAARWIESTPASMFEVKLAFARQAGDEAKHYRLIEERLRELGADLKGYNPLQTGYSPLFQYLTTLTDTVERVAAGQFTRESIALVKNQQFIDLCEAKGDRKTAQLYRDVVQVDEQYHHELGRRILLQYAAMPDAQERARKAATRTLELAEELQGLLLKKTGIHHAPGC